MFNEIEKIDWINTYKVDEYISWDKDIVIYDIPEWIPSSMFNEMVEYILKEKDIPNFDKNRNVIDSIYLDFILVEYIDKNIRDRDIENNKNIRMLNAIKSEAIDWNKQLAENTWNFEYNWKYYLVLNPYNAFTDEINPEKGLYKWVIIDSNKYFEVESQVKEMNSQVQDVLDK